MSSVHFETNTRSLTTSSLYHASSPYDDVMSPTSSTSSTASCGFLLDTPRLGPCDLDPVWPKMSAVAAAGVNKKRKKPEAKPQSQINKCLNEKRRREQENIYIEELAELISASFADMSSLSVKPDKCAILQETVNQIRTIKQQEVSVVTSDAVQQGEVSSSKPTILTNEAFAPLLLEALDGFLFVVNTEGKVEYVTENVSQFIKYTKEEILGKSIYNIIHHGDHARFSSCLLPMSVSWTPLEPHSSSSQQRNRSFNCRLLIKPPDDQDETMEEKQTRVCKYELMQISSTQLPHPGEKSGGGGGSSDGSSTSGGEVSSECSEVGPCLMCVARRIPVEKPNQIGATCEQFTMKLDTGGKIIGVDTSGVSSTYSQYLNKDLMNRTIQELCHGHDLQKLLGHLKEALSAGHSTSAIYRLRVSSTQDKYIHVQTKSKLFKCSGHELDFIMATHSIIGDNDIGNLDSSVSQHSSNNQSSSSSVGGPLICSVNGNNTRSVSSSDIGNTITLNTNTAFHTLTLTPSDLNINDFELFPPSSFVDLMPPSEDRVINWEQPEPRQPLTPAPSPLTPYPAPPQPSPVATTPFQSAGTPFPFSPLPDATPPLEETKDSKEGITENSTTGESLDSGRLRSLLTTSKRPSTDSEEGGGNVNRSNVCILKSTLSQEEDDDRPAPPSSDPPTPKVSSGNNMLLKLLNEKSDDDDLETKVGLKKQNELLQQLLKDNESKTQHHQADDPLLKSLGFHTGSPSPPEGPGRARKRPSEEGEEGSAASVQPAKRGPLSALETLPPVSSTATGNSKLWEKNKMLASLLAKQPSSTPTTIPPIPASVISATPQDKLPRLIKQPISSGNTGWSGGSLQQSSTTSVSRTTVQMTDSVSRQRASQPAAAQSQRTANHVPTSSQFLHSVIDQQQQQQQQLQQQQQQQQQQQAQQARVSFDYRTNQATHENWDLQSSDPLLSELLDQVIDIVPDAIITDSSAIMNILDAIESPATSSSSTTSTLSFQQDMNEKMAINAIQKSLMLCESAVKSPIYNTTMTSNQQQFPPPPMYQQRPRFSLQQSPQHVVRSGTPQFAMANQQQQQLLLQQRSKLLQQQQQKQRLLQQQQQQQLLIPSNAAANTDPGLHNIDSLINNTVAPNVSLQRSSSVPDSQLSPSSFNPGSGTGNSSTILNSGGAQISPSQRQPYSPLSHQQAFSPVNGGMNSFQQQPAQQQQQQQQQQANVQARLSPSGLPPFQQAQLSPRVSQGQQQQQAYTVMSQASTWSQQTNRLSLQQQQNPMLNAQLTGGTYNTNRSFVTQQRTGQQQLPPVRSLTSPGSRQSPFPPEVSPTTAASYQQPTSNQYRLQRTISAPPQATTQLPGGVRHYTAGLSKDHHPLLSPSYPTHPIYPHPPDSPQFCFDQSTLQLYGASCDRSRLPGGGNNGMTEYVRQEIRAMVGARTGGAQGRQPPQQIQVAPGQQVSPAELEALGLTFEMPNTGGSESPKLWGNVGSELSAVSPQPGLSRTNMEEVSRSSDQKSSLLQKLLSE